MLNIGPRLECAASMVRCRTKIVDIGTDHAYLPVSLILSGKIDSALACDIGIMPLKNAESTVAKYCLEDKISLRVSDGLEKVSPDEADEITICGMGGTLIAEILSRADWIRRKGMHLILQPMTHTEDVRRFLYKNGFIIDKEMFVVDNKKVYCCISAEYIGENVDASEGFYYFGFLPPADNTNEDYVSRQLRRINIKIEALGAYPEKSDELNYYRTVKQYYEERMK